MNEIDERIFTLINLLKSYGICKFTRCFCERVGITEQVIPAIKNGRNHFTPAHIQNMVLVYNINANWIFDFTTPNTQVFLAHKTHIKTLKKVEI